MLKTAAQNTPLFLRVVCLYVVALVPIWMHTQFAQSPPVQAAVHIPAAKKEVVKQVIEGKPSRIKIDRLGIDLPVVAGKYNKANDSWTLRDNAVQYATISTQPNDDQGNTFLYGHNTVAVLEPVSNIKVGDVLTITATNGRVFKYAYTKDLSVQPTKTDVITAPSKKPKVTLMTCEGIFSQTRRLMYFDFVEVV